MAGAHLQLDHSTNADWARAYTELGWHVLALAPRSKNPYAGSHGIDDATANFSHLESIYVNNPYSNVGIDPTRSDLIIPDFDFRNGGEDVLAYLLSKHGQKLFATPNVGKASGPHYYFRKPSTCPKRTLSLPGKAGVDLLGAASFAQRKYIVAPGSIHPNGYPYRWISNYSPWDRPLAPFPLEILDTLEEYFARKKEGTLEAELEHANIARLPIVGAGQDREITYEYDSNPRFVLALCAQMGITFRQTLGFSFSSPLRLDKHPSGAIYLCKQGYYRYHDFAEHIDSTLTQLYGAYLTGRDTPLPHLSSVEFGTWQTRMLLDLGMIDCPVPVSICPLPFDAPVLIRKVWADFRVLLQCRAVRYGEVAPVPFSYKFAALWCGISELESQAAVKWLKQKGYLQTIEQMKLNGGRPMNLYLPCNCAPSTRMSKR